MTTPILITDDASADELAGLAAEQRELQRATAESDAAFALVLAGRAS